MTITQTPPSTRGLIIGGEEGPARSGRTTDDLNPVTSEVYARVPAADAAELLISLQHGPLLIQSHRTHRTTHEQACAHTLDQSHRLFSPN